MGAVMPEVLRRPTTLGERRRDVLCVTSADLLFRALRARAGLRRATRLDPRRAVPGASAPPRWSRCSTAHPHALAFLGAVNAVPLTCLGVTRFGQSGDLDDVYRHHEIDAETIVGAALDLLG